MSATRPEANTYSIVGRCARSGELGVAVASGDTLVIAKAQLLPFTDAMPKRSGVSPFPEEVRTLLAPPPPDRPGGGGSRTP